MTETAADVPKREWLLLTSYCGDDNALCTDAKPCPVCLGMSNVFTFPEGKLHYERELAPEWNTSSQSPGTLAHVVAHLEAMADAAPLHGYVDASSYHKAYEQGVREAAKAVAALAPHPTETEGRV